MRKGKGKDKRKEMKNQARKGSKLEEEKVSEAVAVLNRHRQISVPSFLKILAGYLKQ